MNDIVIDTNLGEKINITLKPSEITQDGTPSPDTPQDIHVITGSNNVKISDGTEEQNYPITLGTLDYCKIGDYADQIFKNTIDSEFYDSTLVEGEWYLKKNIEKRIFDGSETNWLKDGNSYKINQSDMLTTNVGNGLCNYFKNSRIDYSYTAGHIRFGWSNTYIYFYVDTENIADVNAWKDWLSTHNTKAYYQLATPQYIHISETDYPILRSQLENLYNNAKSYNGQTNITQTNDDLPFVIDYELVKDLGSVLSNINEFLRKNL